MVALMIGFNSSFDHETDWSEAPFEIIDTMMKPAIQPSYIGRIAVFFLVSQLPVIFRDDFEGGIHILWLKTMPDVPYAGTISEKYAASGSSSYRIELNRSDPVVNGSKRSLLTLLNQEGPLEERIYSFAILLPDGGEEDFALDPEGSEMIVQWYSTPDPGEEWAYPPLALHTHSGEYRLWRAWDDAAVTSEKQMEAKGNLAIHNLGSYESDKGRWVRWTFIIRWGWLDEQNPRIQVFKDGLRILTIEGPNATNDQHGVEMNLGLTKWDWNQGENDTSIVSKRVVYYDDVSIRGFKHDL